MPRPHDDEDESVTPTRYHFLRSKLEGRLFRHYKGGVYRVLMLAVDTANDRPLVITTLLQPNIFPYLSWPLSEFLGIAITPGKLRRVARFKRMVER